MAPFAMAYGVSLFFILLDQMRLPLPQVRYAVLLVFSLVISIPLQLVFLNQRARPMISPYYLPPSITFICSFVKEHEMMMSDIPWAVAWYGQRQCVWLTLMASPDRSGAVSQEDVASISDYQKPIVALYLTPRTTDDRFYTGWIQSEELSWGGFIIACVEKKEVPPTFPLHNMMYEQKLTQYGQIILADRARWEDWRDSVSESKKSKN
jgi:hypothetical protein